MSRQTLYVYMDGCNERVINERWFVNCVNSEIMMVAA